MSDGTEISWSDATLNVVSGCTRVSEACDHCYIERTPPLRMAHRRFDKPGVGGHIPLVLHPERLALLGKWRRPRRIFMPSLADLFHDDVPDDFLVQVFDAMGNHAQHTYQILTKRPARMRSFTTKYVAGGFGQPDRGSLGILPAHIWLGCTVETQKWADVRLPILRGVPAQVRFISAEPLLGPIDLTAHLDALSWVIAGGETGPGARPTHPGWFRSVRDQCTAAGVPFHFKQWGDWTGHARQEDAWHDKEPRAWVNVTDGRVGDAEAAIADGGTWTGVWRVGKKSAGRALDGRTWDEFPTAATP